MSNLSYSSLEFLFHPRSIALVGITVTNPEHWTRTFLSSLLKFEFEGTLYLVNPKGGKIGGSEIYPRLNDIPSNVDYVISTVSAQTAPGLIKECAAKGVKAIHFCTAGFGETGEEERARLEAKLAELSQSNGIRIIGPNCMGIYCPQSRLSFNASFPRESGPVGFISQSGGNATTLVTQAMWRGVRFSKVISYGNACDLDESDFLEYLTGDSDTKIIALYIEGVKDGRRFRQALSKAAAEKVVVLLKGGVTEGGARATAGHTGALAGSETTWDSLCKQLGVIRAHSLQELGDILVTLLFMSLPKGRGAALIGHGGGATVMIADEFEKRGLKVPPIPQEMMNRIQEFTPVAGNILRNPVDYSQNIIEIEKLVRIVSIISQWEGIDFLIGFLSPGRVPRSIRSKMFEIVDGILEGSRASSKPVGVVVEPSILPEPAKEILAIIQKCVSSGLAVYYSFADAANAIDIVLRHNESRPGKL